MANPDLNAEDAPSARVPAASNVARQRRETLYQIGQILKAEWLIRFTPMARWRGTLGAIVTGADLDRPRLAVSGAQLRLAMAHARRTGRAAERLPYSPKCLPQAMALQWKLSQEQIPARLVIAMSSSVAKGPDRVDDAATLADQDRFHAWVELGDTMLIGQCERSLFRAVLAFDLAPGTGYAASGA